MRAPSVLEWDVDTTIVDVDIHDQTLLNVSIALENVKMPFVFANRAKSNDRGYSVSGDSAELREIADALFGPPGTLSTLH